MAKELKSWAVAMATMLIAVTVFCGLTALTTNIFGGSFIINGVAFGLIGVCTSIWYCAAPKQSHFMMKVVATVATLIAGVVIYGMYFLV